MARQVRGGGIDTREARKRLTVRREPHWLKIALGCHLGYRKLTRDRGTWIAKLREKSGQRLQRMLGSADDAMDADGVTSLSFEQAQAKARDWFQSVANGGAELSGGKLTVNGAMDLYLAHIKAHRKSHAHLETYANAYIRPRLGPVPVCDLTAVMIRRWRDDIAAEPPRLRSRKGASPRYRQEDANRAEAERKRRLRANRHLATLKAALNYAWRENLVTHRDQWDRVKLFGNVERKRTKILTPGQARDLVAACGPAMRNLVQAALLTGARYGELCALDAGDFVSHAGALFIRDSKSGKPRYIYLNRAAQQFFGDLSAGKKSSEPMLVMENGERWRRDMYFRPFKAAVNAAGIDPSFTFHELRHTWANLTIMGGAPLMAVAQNLGHSDTRMVERHYGHLTNHFMQQVIAGAAPDFGFDAKLASPLATLTRGEV